MTGCVLLSHRLLLGCVLTLVPLLDLMHSTSIGHSSPSESLDSVQQPRVVFKYMV